MFGYEVLPLDIVATSIMTNNDAQHQFIGAIVSHILMKDVLSVTS